VYNGGDLTTFASYSNRGPVFSSANALYGTGGWAERSIYAQPVPWNADGTPNFGTPAGAVGYNEAAETSC
jgi:hypothetical protein